MDLFDFLRKNELFKGVSDEEIRMLIPQIRMAKYPEGYWILKEGNLGEDLFIIFSGKVSILRLEGGKYRELGTVGPGEWMGEMALVGGGVRTASAKAMEITEVLVIAFSALPKSETFLTDLLKVVPERMRSRDKK
jgi:CRP-like cAMP-binding protein